ncbi:MAG: phage protease [Nitrospirae bacterium YQR-1]
MKVIVCSEIVGTTEEVQVIPYGYHKTGKGDFLCDEDSVDLIMKDFRRRQNDMVIDYEHQTLTGSEAPAAGWIKELIDKGHEGIWAKVEWTDKAKAYLTNKEYRYLSPVFLKETADNRVIKLINAALTNQPAIDGMVPLVNKDRAQGNPLQGRERQSSTTAGKDKQTEVKQMKKVYEALGLKDGDSEDNVLTAVMALKEVTTTASAFKEICEAAGLKPDAGISELKATVLAMKQSHGSVESLTKEVMVLKEVMAKAEAETTVNLALTQGKLMPAQRDWAMEYATKDPDGFKMFAAKAPEAIPLKDITGGMAKNDDMAIDETQLMVNKQLGISDKLWKQRSLTGKEKTTVILQHGQDAQINKEVK